MSYTPTVWANGDIITAEKLNKLENGLRSGGVFWITFNITEDVIYTLDKTYAEIEEAILNGMFPVIRTSDGKIDFISQYGYSSGYYFIALNTGHSFESNSPTGVLQSSDVK